MTSLSSSKKLWSSSETMDEQHACLPHISLQIVVMALIMSSPIAFTGSMYYQLPMCPPFQRFYCYLHFLAKDEVVVDVCIPFTYMYIDYLKISLNKLRITTRNEQCDSIDNENRSRKFISASNDRSCGFRFILILQTYVFTRSRSRQLRDSIVARLLFIH